MTERKIHFYVTFILAACSILYELVIAQSLAMLAANTVIWYSITVGLFLLGMGFGSIVAGYIIRRFNNLNALISVEILLSLFGACSVSVVHFLHMFFAFNHLWGELFFGLLVFYGGTFLITGAIGFLTGIELPLLIELGRTVEGDADKESKVSLSTTLGIDYFGSLVGALLFPLLLLPNFETFSIALGTAVVNISVAIFLLLRRIQPGLRYYLQGASSLVVAALLITAYSRRLDIQQYFLKKYYYYIESSNSLDTLLSPMPDFPRVERKSSPYQKIDLLIDQAGSQGDMLIDSYSDKFTLYPDFPRNQFLFLNGDFQFNSSYEEIYHEYFAHVPMMLRRSVPKEVLVLGGGDGFLVRELLKYKEIEKIVHLDLDTELINFSKTDSAMLRMNRGSLLDRRVESRFGDGFQFARNPDKRYEAIYIDFPAATDYNLAKLYSREFFHFLRDRVLADDGFIVFDSTGTGTLTHPEPGKKQELADGNDWPVYYHTLRAAGFKVFKPYITTLEIDNESARALLTGGDIQYVTSPEVAQLLNAASSSEEAAIIYKAVQAVSAKNIIKDHVVSLQQGFLVLGKEDTELSGVYNDFGLKFHVLNEKRFNLAFAVDFPQPEEIDWSKVNSIMRPTFPTLPVWQPRMPF